MTLNYPGGDVLLAGTSETQFFSDAEYQPRTDYLRALQGSVMSRVSGTEDNYYFASALFVIQESSACLVPP